MIITRTPYRISFFGGGTDYLQVLTIIIISVVVICHRFTQNTETELLGELWNILSVCRTFNIRRFAQL